MPWAVCFDISKISLTRNRCSLTCRCLYKLEPSHHCVIMDRCGWLVHPINSNIFVCLVRRNTATSFLKACSWAGVGSLTFSCLIATWPCHWPIGFSEKSIINSNWHSEIIYRIIYLNKRFRMNLSLSVYRFEFQMKVFPSLRWNPAEAVCFFFRHQISLENGRFGK